MSQQSVIENGTGDVTGLVRDESDAGRFSVHRSVYASPEIFAMERERIFNHCWIYVGHESEIEQPGQFRRRRVAGRPVIFLRDVDGKVRVLLNACTHRGATICRQDAGSAKTFQCFYHAWTFNTRGELVATPDKEGYGPQFDRAQFSLRSPAKVDSYRGFVFMNFDANAMSLVDYLAGAREFIDLVADQTDDGMRVVAGTNLYSAKANWKLMVENATDTYHVPPLHITFTNYVKSTGGGNPPADVHARGSLDLGNGHAVTEVPAPWHRPIAHWEPIYGEDARAEIEDIRRRIIDRHGEVKGRRMAETFRLLVIFPNLVINDIAAITIRYMEPLQPDLVAISAWELAPKEESGRRLSRRLDSFLTFIGPGGLATPDDIEAVESCQQGYSCVDEIPWSDISRGLNGPVRMGNELELRTYWRQWQKVMSEPGTAGNGSVPCAG